MHLPPIVRARADLLVNALGRRDGVTRRQPWLAMSAETGLTALSLNVAERGRGQGASSGEGASPDMPLGC